MPVKKMVVVAAMLAITAGAAAAETITIPANRISGLGDFSASTPDCRVIGKPNASVPTRPAHGKVTFQWVSSRIGKYGKKCEGRAIHAMRVLYQPDKGYRGPDHFTIGMRFPAYEDGPATSYSATDFDVVVK